MILLKKEDLNVAPFRIIYAYKKEEDKIVMLKFGHRKDIYKSL